MNDLWVKEEYNNFSGQYVNYETGDVIFYNKKEFYPYIVKVGSMKCTCKTLKEAKEVLA